MLGRVGIQRAIAVPVLAVAGLMSLPVTAAFLDTKLEGTGLLAVQMAGMAGAGALLGAAMPGIAGATAGHGRGAVVGAVSGVAAGAIGDLIWKRLLGEG